MNLAEIEFYDITLMKQIVLQNLFKDYYSTSLIYINNSKKR